MGCAVLTSVQHPRALPYLYRASTSGTTYGDPPVSPSSSCADNPIPGVPNCRTEAKAAADAAKSGGIQIITIAVRDSSTDLGFLFSLNSTNLGFVTESSEEAELVTDAILGEIDIPCPPS